MFQFPNLPDDYDALHSVASAEKTAWRHPLPN